MMSGIRGNLGATTTNDDFKRLAEDSMISRMWGDADDVRKEITTRYTTQAMEHAMKRKIFAERKEEMSELCDGIAFAYEYANDVDAELLIPTIAKFDMGGRIVDLNAACFITGVVNSKHSKWEFTCSSRKASSTIITIPSLVDVLHKGLPIASDMAVAYWPGEAKLHRISTFDMEADRKPTKNAKKGEVSFPTLVRDGIVRFNYLRRMTTSDEPRDTRLQCIPLMRDIWNIVIKYMLSDFMWQAGIYPMRASDVFRDTHCVEEKKAVSSSTRDPVRVPPILMHDGAELLE